MGRKPNKFKKGQKVMLTETYKARPKMSAMTKVPPGLALTVLKTIPPDSLCDETYVIVKAIRPKDFDLPIPEHMLVAHTPIGEHLYGGVAQDKLDHGVIYLPGGGEVSSQGTWSLGPSQGTVSHTIKSEKDDE